MHDPVQTALFRHETWADIGGHQSEKLSAARKGMQGGILNRSSHLEEEMNQEATHIVSPTSEIYQRCVKALITTRNKEGGLIG